MLTSNGGCAIVVDGSGIYQGIVDMETIITAIRSMREAASEHYRLAKQRLYPAEAQQPAVSEGA
ncbi:hypothetical protein BH20ACT8_BH20ACT8_12870 [soil metagenome]